MEINITGEQLHRVVSSLSKVEINPEAIRLDGGFPNEWDAKEATEIISQVADLLAVQWHEIKKVIDANDGEISLAFKADLDHSREESRVVQVNIAFSRKFKDECGLATIANPDQAELPL